MATRRLKEGEQRLWVEIMREVRPMKGRPPLPTPDPPAVTIITPPAAPVAPVLVVSRPVARLPVSRPPVEIGARHAGLDDTSWRGLSTGRMRPQRRLDLHGQMAQPAFQLLHAFLLRAQAERLRCVEIITGAGSGPDGGILRRELPHWLSRQDLRHLVLAAVHPRPENVGSVRLLLRRRPDRAVTRRPGSSEGSGQGSGKR